MPKVPLSSGLNPAEVALDMRDSLDLSEEQLTELLVLSARLISQNDSIATLLQEDAQARRGSGPIGRTREREQGRRQDQDQNRDSAHDRRMMPAVRDFIQRVRGVSCDCHDGTGDGF